MCCKWNELDSWTIYESLYLILSQRINRYRKNKKESNLGKIYSYEANDQTLLNITRELCSPKRLNVKFMTQISLQHDLKKSIRFSTYFLYTFFLRIFFLLSLSRQQKKGHPVSSARWVNQNLTMQQNAMGNGKASEQHEMRTAAVGAAAGGVGKVKAGVALRRWLIPSSISSRSNCWTLLNMTYLWSASCDTKANCTRKCTVKMVEKVLRLFYLSLSSFSVCLFLFFFSWDFTARVPCPNAAAALPPTPI